MLHVGNTARQLRESLGLTQVEIAEQLGISSIYVSKIENEHSFPTRQIIDRYRECFGIDLYVMAWCQHGDVDTLPAALREPAAALAKAWAKRLETLVRQKRKTGS
jgi:XRE family transcriptional regulator, fatty acid utilization regulator